jgi:MarR family transcriptional regulator, 2-MHQ and catechol-resistance regulon repressor
MGTHYPGNRTERQALSAYIKLMRAAEAVTSRINRHLRREGLTVSQFGVMEAIYHLGPMNQSDLARKILKSSGNLTTVIDNLSREGLVERCRPTEDRRVVNVHLTPKGRELIERIFPPHVESVVESFAVLTDEEQTTLDTLLRKLGKAAAEG